MMKSMASLKISSVHKLEYEDTRAYVQRKTQLGRRGTPLIGGRTQVLETLTRALLLRLRAHGVRVEGKGFESDAVEALFSEVMLEQFRQDQQVRWLVTEALIQHHLDRSNQFTESRTPESAQWDALRNAGSNALLMLQGGHTLASAYLQRASSEGPKTGLTFWKHCQVTIHNRTIDALRKNRKWWKFWEKGVSIDHSATEESYQVPEPRDPHRIGEGALAQARRHRARLEALAKLRYIAEQDASPRSVQGTPQKPDPNSIIVLKYLEWLIQHMDAGSSNLSQAEFARASGHVSDTVGSALSRFRKKHGFDASSAGWRNAHLYTTLGGSQS